MSVPGAHITSDDIEHISEVEQPVCENIGEALRSETADRIFNIITKKTDLSELNKILKARGHVELEEDTIKGREEMLKDIWKKLLSDQPQAISQRENEAFRYLLYERGATKTLETILENIEHNEENKELIGKLKEIVNYNNWGTVSAAVKETEKLFDNHFINSEFNGNGIATSKKGGVYGLVRKTEEGFEEIPDSFKYEYIDKKFDINNVTIAKRRGEEDYGLVWINPEGTLVEVPHSFDVGVFYFDADENGVREFQKGEWSYGELEIVNGEINIISKEKFSFKAFFGGWFN